MYIDKWPFTFLGLVFLATCLTCLYQRRNFQSFKIRLSFEKKKNFFLGIAFLAAILEKMSSRAER